MPKWIIIFFLPIIVGCSASLSEPVGVDSSVESIYQVRQANSNHWSWGEYRFHIDAERSRVEIIPVRNAQHHYNVKTLLENGPCTNCIWIKYLQNNGDDTINLGVAIRHPYPGNDYYTGFDVRGIVHFPAKGLVSSKDNIGEWNVNIPLREAGDPELLNKDGYCGIWGVMHEFPDDPPLKRYQPGGNLGGGITWGYYYGESKGVLKGFKYYHSSENRRYFSTSAVLVRDYHIYLPPGEWDFGYSIDAAWAPPLQEPVIKVPDDFPLSANCMANYRLDADVVGEIDGDSPATLIVDVYNHSGPDAPSNVWVRSGDLFPWGFIWENYTTMTDMGDFARWEIPIYNLNDIQPGWYRMAIFSMVKPEAYPVQPEGIEGGPGVTPWQVVKVKVIN